MALPSISKEEDFAKTGAYATFSPEKEGAMTVAEHPVVRAAIQRFEDKWGVRPKIDGSGQLTIRGERYAHGLKDPFVTLRVINEICDEG